MSYTLTINGHDAPAEDVKAAARDAFAALVDLAGATNGSLSGSGNDGPSFSISFPEPSTAIAEDDPTTSPVDPA
jgi:hypothetical protein